MLALVLPLLLRSDGLVAGEDVKAVRQVRFLALAPQAGRGGEVRARSWWASCFWCCWWWWFSSTVLLRPALVARGVVSVGAGVLVVVVRGGGRAAG